MHNKKRNAGLLYEFLVRHMSNALLHNDLELHKQAYGITLEHFSPGTELHKEFRVFNALTQTRGVNSHIASKIIDEAKRIIRSQDPQKLEREKSALIKEINYTCGKALYRHNVPDYKKFATIQQIFNEWRRGDTNLGRLAQFEQQLFNWLQEPASNSTSKTLDEHIDKDVSNLIFKIANKKLTEKYAEHLTTAQCALMNDYILWDGQSPQLAESLVAIRRDTLRTIDRKLSDRRFCEAKDVGEYVSNKLQAARDKIVALEGRQIDDAQITRHLRLIELHGELKEHK